jgi:hypothetical protein
LWFGGARGSWLVEFGGVFEGGLPVAFRAPLDSGFPRHGAGALQTAMSRRRWSGSPSVPLGPSRRLLAVRGGAGGGHCRPRLPSDRTGDSSPYEEAQAAVIVALGCPRTGPRPPRRARRRRRLSLSPWAALGPDRDLLAVRGGAGVYHCLPRLPSDRTAASSLCDEARASVIVAVGCPWTEPVTPRRTRRRRRPSLSPSAALGPDRGLLAVRGG